MTNKLKCPFCGTELETMLGISESVLGCSKCRHIATIGVWETLIDGKAAQDALNDIKTIYLEAVRIDIQEQPINWFVVARKMYGAEKSIASITKQEK